MLNELNDNIRKLTVIVQEIKEENEKLQKQAERDTEHFKQFERYNKDLEMINSKLLNEVQELNKAIVSMAKKL